ncbi:MAG TPA: SH3 domain-containing protein, partial [Gemmatimonadales bacterium]|nr:SH3 domain-containing protein [Gemmatimonadales bacterium]
WLGAFLLGCPQTTTVTPKTGRDPAARAARDTLLDQRIARLELRLVERDAQIEDLDVRLDEARQEVVRAMAKLQTLASRAEAASAMAEAEIAVQGLRAAAGAQPGGTDVAQAGTLLQQSSAEFAKQNYGGALYLANQAKSLAGAGRNRLGGADRPTLRQGETPFAVPLRLKASARGNVRDGPGAAFKVSFTVEPGTALTGYSVMEQWVRVADEGGRSGWMYVTLVGRRDAPER